MPKGWCPDCETLREISPTGEALKRDGKEVAGQRYWELEVHAKNGEICPGSGKRI